MVPQPGTFVFGGARPPPQSRGSQISPVMGSYQWMMLSSQWPKVWMPQTAWMGVVRRRREAVVRRMDLNILLFGGVVVGSESEV